jgi:tetratricopeptide (TPR) repeat protein
VLCFDDYDDTAVFLDEWLRQLLLGDVGTFSSQILIVIAIRQPLTKPWLAFQRALHQMELEAFSDNEARAYLRQAHIHDPQTIEQLLRQSQKVPRALAELVTQYNDLDDSASLWQRGCGHFEAKAFISALTDFERAIYLQPENDYLYHWRGRTHWETDNQSAALADFSKAIDLEPRRVTYYHWRGLAHRKAQDYQSALADFSEAIQLQPANGNNYWARGYTHREAQNYQAAVHDFSKAIELQPDNINFYYWRGRSYLEMNDTAHAWADFVHIKNILRQKQQPAHYTNGSS